MILTDKYKIAVSHAPLSVILHISSANDENVVNPPQNPAIRNALSDAPDRRVLSNSPQKIPMSKQPNKFTVSVAAGKDVR